MDETPPKRRPSVKQLSKTPSWVMLGFLLGAAFVWCLPRKEPPTRTILVSSEPRKPIPTSVPQISTIEAVFAEWGHLAVWDGDVTQVAQWDTATSAFDLYFEVRRADGAYYFRTLPVLTNRLLRHGKEPPPACPLRFTETEAQYREWREHGRQERPIEDLRPLPPQIEKPATDTSDVKSARPNE
jgi:hypothetical protein